MDGKGKEGIEEGRRLQWDEYRRRSGGFILCVAVSQRPRETGLCWLLLSHEMMRQTPRSARACASRPQGDRPR